ncbi:rhomboid family intramembrane serine protease [Kushneria phosphatilytica]|uniref:Rhomboid family intramembrane serine protease n=1 Tax=Kushneria phosphatilytica TaxID=657387 RepID=A0A1S1NTI8_9GAMM|nr:rhomboid family intramembrane serine protease [Kushneria phosphatilytica]OHV12889.1 rhomboid family intramembrane serine protease [Kushneria phosphatilytica]QEL10747.1 rhomboid family intramembrane serine protease [Kushneria phosphatilytica]
MPTMLRFSHDQDITPLRQALWAHRITHHYDCDDQEQRIWLMDDTHVTRAHELVERWQRGESLTPSEPVTVQSNGLLAALRSAPLVALTLLTCCGIFLAFWLIGDRVLSGLTIAPVTVVGNQLQAGTLGTALAGGQFWRLVTPALLHFSWMHLIFNMLWLWYFGRQVERIEGLGRTSVLLLVAAVASNLAQYATGTVLFGGMSGVDYALLGFVWLSARRTPERGYQIPQALMVFMLIWLVITMTDITARLGFGHVANEAHLGGLLCGLVIAWLTTQRRQQS